MQITESGGNGGDIRKNALRNLSLEIKDGKLPAVLSSYMSGKNLPAEYQGIEPYVREVRSRLINDIGGEPTQLQMVVLDGICETLLIVKFISTFISGDPDGNIITYDRTGKPIISDVATRGFGNFHGILDKKIKQFHEMTIDQKSSMSPREVHRRAIMGEHVPTGRPNNENKEKPIRTAKERETHQMAEMSNEQIE